MVMKRSVGKPKALPGLPAVSVIDGILHGSFNDLSIRYVAVFVDERFVLAAPVTPDAGGVSLAVPLPASLFGIRLDVHDAATGRTLAAPVDLDALRPVRWGGAIVQDRAITGTFTADGTTASSIPVEFTQDGSVYARALASPGPEPHAYQFIAPITLLPPLSSPARLTPSVGGLPLDGTIVTVSAEACGLAGTLDAIDGNFVRGWAVDLASPEARVKVSLQIDGQVVATATASRDRPDLVGIGGSDGRAAFDLPLPPRLPFSRAVRIGVVVAGTELHLNQSFITRPALPRYQGRFDEVAGPFASGWAVNMHAPDTPLEVEAVSGGEVIGTGLADLYRGDVEQAGLPTARCGYRFLLDRPMKELFGRDVVIRIKGTTEVLQGSPQQVHQNPNITRFLSRSTLPAPLLSRLARRATHATTATPISLIMPVYNTRREWLIEALNSVLGQWSSNWELICVDDGSTAPHVAEILAAASRLDSRVRVLRSGINVGIARSVNFALRAARGAYVAFLDHDDVIEPDAVWKLAEAAQQTGADLIYSDEAITTEDIDAIIDVRARPAFSWDYYWSHPYFVHLVAVRTSIAHQVAGWDESMAISADVDFILRVLEASRVVAHVPRVLYRWRTHGGSAGHAKQGQVTTATRDALTRHLARRGLPATVHDGYRYNEYRLDWPDDGGEVLIVIPTKNRVDLLRPCIESIERSSAGANYRIVVIDHASTDPKTVRYLAKIAGSVTVMPYAGPFNYALMNNLAVRTHGDGARYVVFMNNDVEAIRPGWIPRLRSLAGRADVGAVGPLLLYGDDRIQHAGVLVGFSGAADHAMKFINAYLEKDSRNPGYNCNLTVVRDYSAVTAACVMIRMDVFQAVGGFDERFVVGFNDTDLCLRIRDAGYSVLYDGFTVLYHRESATRTTSGSVDHPEDDVLLRRRWTRYFTEGDPFYNPLLAARGTDHTLRSDAGCKGRMAARAVDVQAKPRRPVRHHTGRRRLSVAGNTPAEG